MFNQRDMKATYIDKTQNEELYRKNHSKPTQISIKHLLQCVP